MTPDIASVWAGIIAFAILMYVVMDGFDLGVGILFPFVKDEQDRDLMMNTIAPVWDGNETWLILGGAGLFAAFPLAYAIVLSALYLPIILMLLALVYRGVAFEFRFKDPAHKPIWNISFSGGSFVATFLQGVAIGAFVQGISTEGRRFSGGALDWLTPFSVMSGFALIAGYALLGVTWLILKTEGEFQGRIRRFAAPLAVAVAAAVTCVSIWTLFLDKDIASRWFSWPNILYLAPVPIATGAMLLGVLLSIKSKHDALPFLFSLGVFLLSFAGLGISLFPDVIPPEISIWDAAAPETSLRFLLVGAAVLLPIILAYTAHSYWVFRGKVRIGDTYH